VFGFQTAHLFSYAKEIVEPEKEKRPMRVEVHCDSWVSSVKNPSRDVFFLIAL
jgi:hypothetical protein